MKHLKVIFILFFLLSIAWQPAFSQEDTHKHHDATTQATPKLSADEVVITGEVVCLGCHLKKSEQAKAQCSLYGHTNALLIKKIIDAQGKRLEDLEGRIYQFLHNDDSDKLITEHALVGKVMIITGRVYPQANIIDVRFVKEKTVE